MELLRRTNPSRTRASLLAGTPAGPVGEARPADDVLRLRVSEEGERGLTTGMVERLLTSVLEAGESRVLVLEGSSDAFCRGLNLADAQRGAQDVGRASIEGTLDLLQQLLISLRAAPQPVLAIVDGDAMGGGVGLAAAADVVLASPRATFSLPETLFGVVPGVILPYLADRVGLGRARTMAITGDRVEAARATEWGLVDMVTAELEETEALLIRRLLRQDGAAQATLKRLLATHMIGSTSYAAAAVTAFSGLLSSPETQARITRFAEGKKPWEGDS